MVIIHLLNIKTQGQKIKEIRKRYKIRQECVTGNLVTRNLISMIENDKVNISKNTANIVTENLNKYFKENKINDIVEINYILKTPKDHLEEEMDYILKRVDESPDLIENNLDEFIIEFEYYFKRYELYGLGYEFFRRLGEKIYNLGYYEISREIYIKAFNYYYGEFKIESILNVVYMIGELSLKTKNYGDVMKYNRYLIFETSVQNSTIYKDIEKNELKAREFVRKVK